MNFRSKTLLLLAAVRIASASSPMPVAQQNALVGKYCAVCHMDATPNGGLSLQHFDAARPDAGLNAMLVSKLKGNALGAAGLPLPDKPTQALFQSTLITESAGAEKWVVERRGATVTANVVTKMPSANNGGEPDLFRLTMSCQRDRHAGRMQVAWSPAEAKSGQVISASVDGGPSVTTKVEGVEKMGNGQAGTSGPGSVQFVLPLPAKTLAVSSVFGDEAVVFPFDQLNAGARDELRACFGGGQ